MRRIAPLLLVLALVGVACGSGDRSDATTDTVGAAEPLAPLSGGDPLPEASLPMLRGQGTLTTGQLTGTPTVLNFWATWCPFCVDEMPAFEAVHQQLAGEVRFVGVDVEDSREKALTLAEETGVTYTLVEDTDRSFLEAVRGRGMPTTVFVSPEGVIEHRHVGPLTGEQLLELIGEHFDVRVPSA